MFRCEKEEAADEGVATVLPDEKNEVTVLPLKRQIFNHELVSNGKIVAGGMADCVLKVRVSWRRLCEER